MALIIREHYNKNNVFTIILLLKDKLKIVIKISIFIQFSKRGKNEGNLSVGNAHIESIFNVLQV